MGVRGCLFEAGHLLTFPTYEVSTYLGLETLSNKYSIQTGYICSKIIFVLSTELIMQIGHH